MNRVCNLFYIQDEKPTFYRCKVTGKLFPYDEWNKVGTQRLPKNDEFHSKYWILTEIKPRFLCCRICKCPGKFEKISDATVRGSKIKGYKSIM